MKARGLLAVFVATLALPAAASASTTTLGSIVAPAGGAPVPCEAAAGPITPLFVAGSPNYVVGSGISQVTSWSVNATGDVPGGAETLYILAPSGASDTVVATDAETIPAVIPASGTVTFTLANPVTVASGDTFGLSSGTGSAYCAWVSADPSDQISLSLLVGGALIPASALDAAESTLPARLDVAVTLSSASEDAAVTTAAGPSNAVVGNEALLSSTVTNNGPFAGPITFTDAVPSGLTVNAAAASGGTCTTAGQVVTCTLASLASGASAPVEIVVTPTTTTSHENTVLVADESGVTDPNPANNSASATLTVAAATIASSLATRECVASNVKGLSEKVVKRLLPSFGCKLGKVKKARSKSVAKGDVISLKPDSGAHPAGTKVTLTVSSGKPKAKH
jgi:uncharacterized repeat protein (TIGR01451 family)